MNRLPIFIASLLLLMSSAAQACRPASHDDIRSHLVRATPTQAVPDMLVFWPCRGLYSTGLFWRGITSALMTEQNYALAVGFMRGKNDALLDAPLTLRQDDPRIAHLKAKLDEELAKEKAAGTWPPDPVWVVAKNPQSTSTPPTRPMLSYPELKTLSKRAVVGARCDCKALVITKGTRLTPTVTYTGSQTLCWLADSTQAVELAACERAP